MKDYGEPPAHALSLEEARARIVGALAPVATLERVAVRDALDRVPGADVARPAGAMEPVAGRRIRPADLGALAAAGITEVTVRRRLRVAIFSLGDALRSPGERLREGDVYDGNRYALGAMLAHAGAAVLDLGVIRGGRRTLRAALADAGAVADAVIAASGITIRSHPGVRDVLEAAGDVAFIDVRVKPCRPVPFGRLAGGAAFFGLSSNPLPLAVMFRQLVQPALDRLAGAAPRVPLAFDVPSRGAFHGVPGWLNFRRGRLEADAAGALTVDLAAPGDRGIVRTLRDANCFIVLAEDAGAVQPGDRVRVEPFAGDAGCISGAAAVRSA